MELSHARNIAQGLVARLQPHCTFITIAGSIRREKPDVHDIEIVCQPIYTPSKNLFGEDALIDSALERLDWSSFGRIIKHGMRYKQIALPEGINLDLFINLPPSQLGVLLALRTGPADYSHWLVTARRAGGALPGGCQIKDGNQFYSWGKAVDVPTEERLYELLGLPYTHPRARKPLWA